jgi:DnaJ-class molecular chaperone
VTPDPYVRLGVPQTASAKEITGAYRRLAQRWHPDRHPGDPQAVTEFLAIQAAYQLLRDPVKRKDWDRRQSSPQDSAFRPDPHWTDRFRPAWTPRPQPPGLPGDHAHEHIQVTLASVFQPQSVLIHYNRAVVCPHCAGHAPQCAVCGGTGQRFLRRALRVNLPAGIHEGQVLQVRGEGHDGPRFSVPGDLWLGVSWTKAGRWRWRHDRLEARYRLPRKLVKHGGALRIKSPEGTWGTLTVPPMSVGQWIRVPHLGLPLPQAPTQRGAAWIELV